MNRRCYVCHSNDHLSANCQENVITRCFMCFREIRSAHHHEANCQTKEFISSDIDESLRQTNTKIWLGGSKVPKFEVNKKIFELEDGQGMFVSPDKLMTIQSKGNKRFVIDLPKYYHVRLLFKTKNNYLLRCTHTMLSPYLETINKPIMEMSHEDKLKLHHYALLEVIVDDNVMFAIEANGKRIVCLVNNGNVRCQHANHTAIPSIQL